MVEQFCEKSKKILENGQNAQQPTSGLVVLRRERCDSFSHADEKMMERFKSKQNR